MVVNRIRFRTFLKKGFSFAILQASGNLIMEYPFSTLIFVGEFFCSVVLEILAFSKVVLVLLYLLVFLQNIFFLFFISL